jgi:hypothetical protein
MGFSRPSSWLRDVASMDTPFYVLGSTRHLGDKAPANCTHMGEGKGVGPQGAGEV